MESELQYVARHLLDEVLEATLIPQGYLDRLKAADPQTVDDFQSRIHRLRRQWMALTGRIPIEEGRMFWAIAPTRENTEDGIVVTLKWGWKGERSVKMKAKDALGLAVSIAELFSETEEKEIYPDGPPREPSAEVREMWAEFDRETTALREFGIEELSGGISGLDVDAWVKSGRAKPPLMHHWEPYPEDAVVICSVCGHFYSTDDSDWPSVVCAGYPLKDPHWASIHNSDPRRTPELRETQRLDRIVAHLEHCRATKEEMASFRERFEALKERLTDVDKERYFRERAGFTV